MMWRRTIISVIVLGLFSGEILLCQSEIPSFIKTCHRSDPELSNCIKESINILKPYLRNGIPELQMSPLDSYPFENLEYEKTGFNHVLMKCTNVHVNGGSNFELNSLWFDPGSNVLTMQLHFPRLDIMADYNLVGKVFFVWFNGNDKLEATFTNVDVMTSCKLNPYYNSMTGLTHRRLEDIQVSLSVGHGHMDVHNIQPNQFVSGTVNAFLNLNWRRMVQKLTPQLERSLANMLGTYSNQIFMAYPDNVLLPV